MDTVWVAAAASEVLGVFFRVEAARSRCERRAGKRLPWTAHHDEGTERDSWRAFAFTVTEFVLEPEPVEADDPEDALFLCEQCSRPLYVDGTVEPTEGGSAWWTCPAGHRGRWIGV